MNVDKVIWDSLEERTEDAIERINKFSDLIRKAEDKPDLIIEGKLNYL